MGGGGGEGRERGSQKLQKLSWISCTLKGKVLKEQTA